MPYMVICKGEDGQILVNAGGECPPELLEGAQPAQSIDEAAQMVKDVLGDAAGEQAQQPAADEATPAPSGAEGMPMETPDDAMAAGFQRAKKGY